MLQEVMILRQFSNSFSKFFDIYFASALKIKTVHVENLQFSASRKNQNKPLSQTQLVVYVYALR
jgi:hypothetical protein